MSARRLTNLTFCFLVPATLVRGPARAEESPERAQSPPLESVRTVAIGDVHGDYAAFLRLLVRLGLVDERTAGWTGGTRHLIQTGDIVDRGAGSRRVLELLMKLEDQAGEAGGRVTVLLGNHEVLNLTGNLYYVSAGEYAAFADDEEPGFRRRRIREILALLEADQPLARSAYHRQLRRLLSPAAIERLFPRGYFAHRRAFSPDGTIGKWLLERDAVHVEKGTLFVHGGISPSFSRVPAREINARVRKALESFLDAVSRLEELGVFHRDLGLVELGIFMRMERLAGDPHTDLADVFSRLDAVFEGPLFAKDGPLWYRGLAEHDERRFRREVLRILDRQDVRRIVVGHTQHPTMTVRGRFGDRVILIDTGMNQDAYGGRPSALLFHADNRLSVFE